MIVTVTPNPSVDRTLVLDGFRPGAVNRAREQHVEPSGKGVNVTCALLANGVESTAVLPLGGSEGAQLGDLLQAQHVPFVPVPVGESVRVNISLLHASGSVTKINEVGPALSRVEVASLVDTAARLAHGAVWVVGSGSLPPGADAEFYGELARRVHEAGARFALDTSGAALIHGVAAQPDVVKPNVDELAESVGRPLRTLGDVCDAAREFCQSPATRVLVSLGPDGAVLVHGTTALHAEAPAGQANNTVGAGDNLLAGFLTAGGDGASALAEAVAWGSVAVRAHGTHAEPVTDADRSTVLVHRQVEMQRPLRNPAESPSPLPRRPQDGQPRTKEETCRSRKDADLPR